MHHKRGQPYEVISTGAQCGNKSLKKRNSGDSEKEAFEFFETLYLKKIKSAINLTDMGKESF